MSSTLIHESHFHDVMHSISGLYDVKEMDANTEIDIREIYHEMTAYPYTLLMSDNHHEVSREEDE